MRMNGGFPGDGLALELKILPAVLTRPPKPVGANVIILEGLMNAFHSVILPATWAPIPAPHLKPYLLRDIHQLHFRQNHLL